MGQFWPIFPLSKGFRIIFHFSDFVSIIRTMKEEVVRSRATGEHWLVERKENGVTLKNFKGQTISLDWPTFNFLFEYPF